MKKIKPITVIALTIMAISLTMLDFENLNAERNYKWFGGILIFIALLFFDLYSKNKSKHS